MLKEVLGVSHKDLLMGRWLTKKGYRLRAERIIELRDKKHLKFSDIAKRMGVQQGVIEYSYHHFKEKA